MIEQTKVNGQPATVAYLTDQLEPADKETATLLKVVFQDGTVVFLAQGQE